MIYAVPNGDVTKLYIQNGGECRIMHPEKWFTPDEIKEVEAGRAILIVKRDDERWEGINNDMDPHL